MSRLAFLFIFLLHLFQSPQTLYTRMVDTVESSIFRLSHDAEVITERGPQTHQAVCSGIAIAPHRILTAAHCLSADYPMYADGLPAKILKVNLQDDLALLATSGTRPLLTISPESIQLYDRLTAIGYAYGNPRLSVLQVAPFQLHMRDPGDARSTIGILVQPGYIGGMSGGPLVNAEGQLVGIIQRRADEGVGYGVGVEVLRVFLLGEDEGR